MKTKTKRITAFALVCSIVAFVGAFFIIKPITARAEVVQQTYTYLGNDLWSPAVFLARYDNGSYATSYNQLEVGYFPSTATQRRIDVGFVNFQVNLRTTDDGKLRFDPVVYLAIGQRYDGTIYYPSDSVLNMIRMERADFSFPIINDTTLHSSWFHQVDPDLPYRPYIRFDVQLSSMDFKPDIIKVTMDSRPQVISGSYVYYYNRIRYYDHNNNYCQVEIFANDGGTNIQVEQGWENRTYYLNNMLNWTDDQAYKQGFSDGENEGYSNGYDKGYAEGDEYGYQLGDQEGYYRGLNDGRAENITFLSLLTAIFDAPIQAVFNALDFEILGMNMKNFFYGLLSISLVIFVIRFITGKKTDE